jgi:hypothetical protein
VLALDLISERVDRSMKKGATRPRRIQRTLGDREPARKDARHRFRACTLTVEAGCALGSLVRGPLHLGERSSVGKFWARDRLCRSGRRRSGGISLYVPTVREWFGAAANSEARTTSPLVKDVIGMLLTSAAPARSKAICIG